MFRGDCPPEHYLPYSKQKELVSKELSVTVLLPVHNGELYLEQAVEAVMGQSHALVKLIIIEDSSTDATFEVACRLQKIHGNRISVLCSKVRNQAAALNMGLKHVDEDFVALLDVDDVWTSDKISQQLYSWCSNPVGLHVTDFAVGRDHTVDSWVSSWETQGYQRVTEGYAFPSLIDENFILRSSALIPTIILCDMHGFDSNISGSDDRDLWLRIAEKYPIGILRKVLCFKTVHEQAMSRSFSSNLARINLWLKWCKRLEQNSEKELLKTARHNLALFTFNYGYMHHQKKDGDKWTAVLFFLKSVRQWFRPAKSLLLACYNLMICFLRKIQQRNKRNYSCPQ